jgi:hypothetical protein
VHNAYTGGKTVVFASVAALRGDFRQLQKLVGSGMKIGGNWGCGSTTLQGSKKGVHKTLYQYHHT